MSDDERRERKRRQDREAKARKRAAMTPLERAKARAPYDAGYRERHLEERRAAGRRYWATRQYEKRIYNQAYPKPRRAGEQ